MGLLHAKHGLLKVPTRVGATPPWPTIAKAAGGSLI